MTSAFGLRDVQNTEVLGGKDVFDKHVFLDSNIGVREWPEHLNVSIFECLEKRQTCKYSNVKMLCALLGQIPGREQFSLMFFFTKFKVIIIIVLFKQLNCCGSDEMPFSSTRIEPTRLVSLRCEEMFNTHDLPSDDKHGASKMRFMHLLLRTRDSTLPAHSCAGVEVFTPFEFQQGQLLLLIRNPFLVLVLGFGVVECRNEGSFQIVGTGVVRNFQNRLLADTGDPSACFTFASGLSLGHPGGLASHSFTFTEGHTKFCPINLLETCTTSRNEH